MIYFGYPWVENQTRNWTRQVSGPKPENCGWKIIPKLEPARIKTRGYPTRNHPAAIISAGLGLKTRAEVPRWNGRHVAASSGSRRDDVISWRARWPSDEQYVELD